MLKRQLRLPVDQKIRFRRFVNTPFFTIRIVDNTLSHNRFGFIVSKKVDKRAVIRNRVKRRVRGCIEKQLIVMKKGYDVLVIPKTPVVSLDQTTLCYEVHGALKKLSLL